MGGPSWLADILAVIMLVVAVYCAIRLVLGPVLHRRVECDIDLVHVGMGVAMAGMLVPGLNPWAGHLWDTGWEVTFGVALVYFLALGVPAAVRRNTVTGHYLPHAVHSYAMIYMLLAFPAMASSSTTTTPTLALVLGLFMVGYTVLLINHITPLTADTWLNEPASLVTASVSPASVSNQAASVIGINPNPGLPLEAGQTFPTSPSLLAPRAATIYKIAMSLTMAYMLVTML